ncbi:hypothetical protein KPATCC21470_0549 [Kitasatospora purpeofusca]
MNDRIRQPALLLRPPEVDSTTCRRPPPASGRAERLTPRGRCAVRSAAAARLVAGSGARRAPEETTDDRSTGC